MASAMALARHGHGVTLFEARRRLGGRASSFSARKEDRPVDLCQHVSMECCTNLADFCRRTEIANYFRRVRRLHFFSLDGCRYDIGATRWLPAPFHLGPSMLRFGVLTFGDRLRVACAMTRLASTTSGGHESIEAWLVRHGQSSRAIRSFWATVLVSALGNTLDRISVTVARKVFVDGFLATSHGYELLIPTIPLGELYGDHLLGSLAALGIDVQLGTSIARLEIERSHATALRTAAGERRTFDYCVLSVPWRQAGRLLPPDVVELNACREQIARIEGSPITSVHLWFDRPIMALRHAVLVDRLSQWIFARPSGSHPSVSPSDRAYYQVVISASRELVDAAPREILVRVIDDLSRLWPVTRSAQLLDSYVVTDKEAVFAPRPELDGARAGQRTPIGNLMVAGDWTATGWPSTMEGAVRSGYLAAEAVLEAAGTPERVLVAALPRNPLVRWLFGPA